MPKPIPHDDLSDYVNTGLSDAEISRIYGVLPKTISVWRWRASITAQSRSIRASRRVFTHGTIASYNNGCRCTDCMRSNKVKARVNRKKRLAKSSVNAIPNDVEHGGNAARNWGCRCEVCLDSVRRDNLVIRHRARTGQIHHVRGGHAAGCPCESCRRYYLERFRLRNAQSKDVAHRDGYVWTGPELEMAMRKDLTIRELSESLGRTLAAVAGRRSLLNRNDPKQSFLLGETNTSS